MKFKVEVWGEVNGRKIVIGECSHSTDRPVTETPFISIPKHTKKIKIVVQEEKKWNGTG